MTHQTPFEIGEQPYTGVPDGISAGRYPYLPATTPAMTGVLQFMPAGRYAYVQPHGSLHSVLVLTHYCVHSHKEGS